MNAFPNTDSDVTKLCRLCLKNDGEFNIFTFSSNFKDNIANVLAKCAPIRQIIKSEGLPNSICNSCQDRLKSAYDFQTQTIQSEEMLYLYTRTLKNVNGKSNKNFSTDSEQWGLKTNSNKFSIRNITQSATDDFTYDPSSSTSESKPKLQSFIKIEAFDFGETKSSVKDEKNFSKWGSDFSNNSESDMDNTELEDNKDDLNFTLKNKTTTKLNFLHNKLFQNTKKPTVSKSNVGTKTKSIVIKVNERKKYVQKRNANKKSESVKKCNICNKPVKKSANLKPDDGNSDDDICKCTEAEKIAYQKSHSAEKTCQCDTCGLIFAQESNLRFHKQTHSDEKPHMCDICEKRFKRSEHLKRHKLIHNGEKIHMCDVCGKCFLIHHNLVRHKKIHTGEKRFQCDICEKRFMQSSHLKTHKNIHSGEKPYCCDICNKRFTHLSTLRTHKGTHVQKKPAF